MRCSACKCIMLWLIKLTMIRKSKDRSTYLDSEIDELIRLCKSKSRLFQPNNTASSECFFIVFIVENNSNEKK